ncbi:MAG TPA: MerR family transcriptional regulator [Polyangiales bacterium]|nr:MerR family transcriptional regulator [Polyangiales bacterium]
MAIQLPVIKAQGRWKISRIANGRVAPDSTPDTATSQMREMSELAEVSEMPIDTASHAGDAANTTTDQPVGLEEAPRSLLSRNLRVGELARKSGKTVRALHLYEERGLLDPIERSKGGYRLYAKDALVRVRWISKLQDMGFSLNDIQSMLRQWETSGSAPRAMLQVGEVLKEKLEETREQIARLQALEHELRSSLEYLETCPKCSPQQELTACHSCELHEQGAAAPDLVAGFHAH